MQFKPHHKPANRPPRLPAFLCTFVAFMVCARLSAEESAIDPDEELAHIRWTDTERLVGQVAFVSGKIAAVGHSRKVHFLNFDARRRDVFNIVIFDEHLQTFPDKLESLYKNKIIEVRGVISRFKDHTQIRVTSPDQIQVLAKLPPTQWRKVVEVELGQHLTIGTFNVLNLFDAEDDPYRNDETTTTKSRDDLRLVATIIRDIDADVLALQEVENRGYLRRFLDVLLQDFGYRNVVHYEGNDERGIDVCLVSRVPIGPVTSYRHLQFPDADGTLRRFQRDLLSVRVEPTGSPPFDVWVVHLKSKGGDDSQAAVRLAEAQKIRELLDERFAADPMSRIVVCGDFNDTFDSVPLQTIANSPSGRLVSFFDKIPPANRITYNREPHREMIDFILCSPAMAKDYVEHSYKIFYGSTETTGSDHNPVVAAFRRESAGSR